MSGRPQPPRAPCRPSAEVEGAWLVPLTKGTFALVDECDLWRVESYRWGCAGHRANRARETAYAYRVVTERSIRRTIWMHRVIADAPDGVPVDHANRSGLDNRRANLRLADSSKNAANASSPPNASGYRGVKSPTRKARWRARICVRGQFISIGSFGTALEAALAYDRAALQFFGEFATLNFPAEQSNGLVTTPHDRRNEGALNLLCLRDQAHPSSPSPSRSHQ